MTLGLVIIPLAIAAFFGVIAAARIIRALRKIPGRLSSVPDIDELEHLLASGHITQEEHDRLLHRCMERRREAGIIGTPRGFDVKPPPAPPPDEPEEPAG